MPVTFSLSVKTLLILSACRFWDYSSFIKSSNSWKPLDHLNIIAITTARIKYILEKNIPSKIVLTWYEFKGNSYYTLRWLDTGFQGQYLSILGIIKDLEILFTTAVLDKEENFVMIRLPWHPSCHSNEMTPFAFFLLAGVFLGTGNCSSKIVHGGFFSLIITSSMFVTFKRNLWERDLDILGWSFCG